MSRNTKAMRAAEAAVVAPVSGNATSTERRTDSLTLAEVAELAARVTETYGSADAVTRAALRSHLTQEGVVAWSEVAYQWSIAGGTTTAWKDTYKGGNDGLARWLRTGQMLAAYAAKGMDVDPSAVLTVANRATKADMPEILKAIRTGRDLPEDLKSIRSYKAPKAPKAVAPPAGTTDGTPDADGTPDTGSGTPNATTGSEVDLPPSKYVAALDVILARVDLIPDADVAHVLDVLAEIGTALASRGADVTKTA